MIRKIDHVAIAVPDLDEGLAFWSNLLGLRVGGTEQVETEQVRVAFLEAGPSRVELLEPTDDKASVAEFLRRRGAGLHHLTFEVQDLRSILERLRAAEVPLAGEAPRAGAGGRSVAFLHPKGTGGVLVELVEASTSSVPSEGRSIAPGDAVLAYLREPQEKLWGLLRRIDSAGIVVEGVDLASFEIWLAQVERQEEGLGGPSVLFVPMARVDKVLLDRATGPLPSLAQRFEGRVGCSVAEAFARLAEPS